jgi:hypothetical protein
VKHSTSELITLAHHYFPRGMAEDDPRYEQTEEWHRRKSARARAGEQYEVWRTMLQRIQKRFPLQPPLGNMVEDRSLFLQSPTAGPTVRCFSAALWMPGDAAARTSNEIELAISFIAPCYVIFGSRAVPIDPTIGLRETERQASFDLSSVELPFATAIAEEIALSFPDHEPMPPEVGNVIVPEISSELPPPAVATLFECLFSSLCVPRR